MCSGVSRTFVVRLEELQRQYAGAIRARNTVEYQYQVFRSLDRPPVLLPPPPRFNFVPATPTPSTYTRLPPELPAQLQQLQSLYQQRQQGIPASWKGGGSFVQPPVPTVHPPGNISDWQTTAPPPACPALVGSGRRSRGLEASRLPGAALSASAQGPVTAAGVAPQVFGQREAADWYGLGPVQQQKVVNPALVFAKETMDQVLQQLKSESVSLQNQSREIGLKLSESKEKSEVEKWRSMGVNELLCEMSEEQHAFIKEQLRAIDRVRDTAVKLSAVPLSATLRYCESVRARTSRMLFVSVRDTVSGSLP